MINPEFRRNLWLELTWRRVVTMTIVLLLIFFAASLSGSGSTPSGIAQFLYYLIVVLWGTRNAALSVVGEIRDRTWDFQRLSSLGAVQMTWGKLFGSTAFNWYGGALCLVVVAADRLAHQGPLVAFIDIFFMVVTGLIAQSTALLASLVAAMRRQTHTRLEVFVYQGLGWIAAGMVVNVWEVVEPASIFRKLGHVDTISWWNRTYDSRLFLLASLAVFAGWILLGCYRAMRLELKLRNGPFVWLAFLAFMGAYVAGFDTWLSKSSVIGANDVLTLRLALAGVAFVVLTYAMVLLEPKDRVLYRWMGSELTKGHFGSVAFNLQGWMMSCKAAFLAGIALMVWLVHQQTPAGAYVAGAELGFLLRDVAIVVLLQTLPGPRRGDFAALVALFALYVLAPAIANGLDLKASLVLFYPELSTPPWLSPAVAWGEAVTFSGLVLARLAAGTKQAASATA